MSNNRIYPHDQFTLPDSGLLPELKRINDKLETMIAIARYHLERKKRLGEVVLNPSWMCCVVFDPRALFHGMVKDAFDRLKEHQINNTENAPVCILPSMKVLWSPAYLTISNRQSLYILALEPFQNRVRYLQDEL